MLRHLSYSLKNCLCHGPTTDMGNYFGLGAESPTYASYVGHADSCRCRISSVQYMSFICIKEKPRWLEVWSSLTKRYYMTRDV
jgi:hypothetical protein